ncbi:HCNGP-like protein-domain-containing protein [Cryomyces antarcticus]
MATLGLGDYGSSDEEGEEIGAPIVARTAASDRSSTAASISKEAAGGSGVKHAQGAIDSLPQLMPQDLHDDTSAIGPALEPQGSISMANPYASGTASAPQSPYTSERLLIRDLTMPPMPNFNIPQSPPSSPSAIVSSKFGRFLELKNQGVHFNERLEKSSALKNPSLLQKMTKFAGVEEQDQFASTLPPSLAVPTSFPAWAYADELAKTQQAMTKKLEEDRAKIQREAIDFVPAAGSAASSRGATPGATGGRGVKGSAAERVMAGLNRDRSGSPAGPNGGNVRDVERSGRRMEGRRNRFDDSRSWHRSRSPRHRQSRSR